MPTITIYTTPTCAYCHLAKEYFDKKELHYTERDMTVDQTALRFVLEKVGQAVSPIITIDDTVIIGFDRPKIDAALAASSPVAVDQSNGSSDYESRRLPD